MTIGWRNKYKSSLYWSQVLMLLGRGSLITKISVRVALFKNISLDIPCLVFSSELLIIGLSTFWNISHLQPALPHKYVQCILPAQQLTVFRQNMLNIMGWFDTFKPTKIYDKKINPIFKAKSNHALALSQKLLSNILPSGAKEKCPCPAAVCSTACWHRGPVLQCHSAAVPHK